MKKRRGLLFSLMCVLLWFHWSCGLETSSEHTHWHGEEGDRSGQGLGQNEQALRVSEAVTSYCSTSAVRGLSEQLVAEINCLRPGTMGSIKNIRGLTLGSAVIPWLQKPAADALRQAVSARKGEIFITSALRTLPQQYLLYQWYLRGRCGISLAAPPGASNHEAGLAIDTSDYSAWRSTLSNSGFRWLGGSDPVHFDYVRGGTDIRTLSVLAFQRLWNRNHPKDRIGEDGGYGPQTAARLVKAPGEGFPVGAVCQNGGGTTQPPPPQKLEAIEVYWAREADERYKLHALASQRIVKVEYYVDGFKIGTSERKQGENFPAFYRFDLEKEQRRFEVRGIDSNGKQIGLGVGLLDVGAGTSFSIRQMGEKLYEVFLERAPSGLDAIEVDIDQFAITDSETNTRRSKRRAVRFTLNQLGERKVTLSTFNADGSLRGRLSRNFTFR